MAQNDIQAEVAEVLTNYLVSHNQRKTPERYAILHAIYEGSGHFTVDDLYTRMETLFKVSRATVYNALELFVELGLLIRHSFGKTPCYEKCYGVRDHFHQVCLRCGSVTEIHSKPVSASLNTVRYKRFHAQTIAICAYGICSKCQAVETRKKRVNLTTQLRK